MIELTAPKTLEILFIKVDENTARVVEAVFAFESPANGDDFYWKKIRILPGGCAGKLIKIDEYGNVSL